MEITLTLCSSLVFKDHDPNTARIVSGVIRLADKYLIEPLHRRLVQQVCDDWPTTLNDYDISQAEIDTLEGLSGRSVQDTLYPCGEGPYPRSILPEPISAIQFAQEFGCPQILRAAFYRLSLTLMVDLGLFGFGHAASTRSGRPSWPGCRPSTRRTSSGASTGVRCSASTAHR